MTLATKVSQAMFSKDMFSQHLGLELLDSTSEYCVMALTVSEHHLNGYGICHGGTYFTLADTTFAHLCNADNHVALAQMCNITYLAPAKLSDRLIARGECTGKTGRSGVYDITITRESDGNTLALFRGHSRKISGTVLSDEELSNE